MEECETCGNDHDGTYGAGRFCSLKCANSRGERSTETRKKISIALGGIERQERKCEVCPKTFWITKRAHLERKFCSQKCANTSKIKGKFSPRSLWDCAPKTICKVLKRLNKMLCSNCGWDKATCDVHHIKGRKIENPHAHSNLTLLCPNCHRLAHAGVIPVEMLVSFEVFLGTDWEKAYYG